MNHYKDTEGKVYGFESDELMEQYKPGLTKMTEAEFEAFRNPPPGPAPVPETVSRAQGKMALVQAGLWGAVETAVDAMTGNDKIMAQIALNDTTDWRRDSPFLTQMADAVGITESQLDDLFIAASQIEI